MRAIRVRPAASGDINRLCELLGELFSQEAEFSPEPARQRRALRSIIDTPDCGTILVALDEHEVLGMVLLLYTVSTALGGRVALLEDMIVTAAARGDGVGRQLITAATRVAREQGCLRITLLTDNSNHRAQGFYRDAGFRTSEMRPLRLDLTAEPR